MLQGLLDVYDLRSLSGQLRAALSGPAFAWSLTGYALKNATFVEPQLVGEVEFSEWTRSGTLRQPSFKGLREDKDPRQVVREEPPDGNM